MARASLVVQTRRTNLAVRLLQQEASSPTILAALIKQGGLSRRQAYRYLAAAQTSLQVQPLPEPKAVFTVHVPRRLIRSLRARARAQQRPLSHVVAQALERGLQAAPPHG